MTQAFRELVQIGITLTSEQDLGTLLERILPEARRFTRAEAGTLFLREGDQLRFSVVQNDKLARELGQEEMRRRLQADPLSLRELSLAGHVALTGDILNLHDTYMIPPDRPYSFDPRVDARLNYRTQSILVVPLQDPANNILGVLELINALDRGRVVPFDSQYEGLVRSLASQAAVALRNARLEDLSFKDALTDVYNRRYFTIRMEEEFKRHCRFGEPLSLALMDLDHFKEVNDTFGHLIGDRALKAIARTFQIFLRDYDLIGRFGGEEFALLLPHTNALDAYGIADRIREHIAIGPLDVGDFPDGEHVRVTVSIGVAALGAPWDTRTGSQITDLLAAADRALYQAKRAGRDQVCVVTDNTVVSSPEQVSRLGPA